VQVHHKAWLEAHPERTARWLREMLRDGFSIHHLDGNHGNNDPDNLVLIENTDHALIHNGFRPDPATRQVKKAGWRCPLSNQQRPKRRRSTQRVP
jgi:hypothetical protein